MNRRQFLQTSVIGAASAAVLNTGDIAYAQTSPFWPENAYRRNVIDMHITDWNETFLTKFDPKNYVEMLRRSQVQSAVVYAHSHVGLCYFPTKVGKQHRAFEGKDYLKQIIDGCDKYGIYVVLYYSTIFDRWASDQHPDWRMKHSSGGDSAKYSRHGFCCPNSPYRAYVIALIDEISRLYRYDGMRFDMVFWPTVCYCKYCQKRFAAEVGGELPKTIHWEDPRWVAFQRAREQWLIEFAAVLTQAVKRYWPKATVEHQASTYTSSWRLGVSAELAEENDFLQGDFYGDALQGSFARKLFYNLSPNLPYGFETSVMAQITNHTAIKPTELLQAKAAACMADGGAFVFIDAVDPVGTLNAVVYETMKGVFERTKPYEADIGGELCQDVAIYLSTESKCDFADNGKPSEGATSSKMPHVDAAVSVCKSLRENHIPFGVITKRNLAKLSRHQMVVLPNVLMMDDEEVAAVKDFVKQGGALYASKYTSLFGKDGKRYPDFMLADVFGVSYVGQTKEFFTYVAPTENNGDLYPRYSVKHPMGLDVPQLIVKPHAGARLLGKMVLPYADPTDINRYASIHSNPPGQYTDHPSIVLNQYGKGQAIYAAGELETSDLDRDVFIRLLGRFRRRYTFSANAPAAVEVTAFHQADRKRYIVNLVNFQKELPNIPIDGISVSIRPGGKKPKGLSLLPNGQRLDFTSEGDYVKFTAPRLQTLAMFALDYEA